MPDTVDKATRSRIMASVPTKDTKPEFALRRALHARGLRYRLHVRRLPGTPDLVFSRFRAVCFVHGCFWHRHRGCPHATDPATRREFWQAKFKANVERDRRNRQQLLDRGWRVAIVWQCALRHELVDTTSRMFDQWLRGSEREFETSSTPSSYVTVAARSRQQRRPPRRVLSQAGLNERTAWRLPHDVAHRS